VRVELPKNIEAQKAASAEWRKIERRYRSAISDTEKEFEESRSKFLNLSVKGPFMTANSNPEPDEADE